MKKVFNLIIVDESGSMSCIRKQAFAGMNETLATVRQMQNKFKDTDQRVTLITFDSEHIKWHYDNMPASKTIDLEMERLFTLRCHPTLRRYGKCHFKSERTGRERRQRAGNSNHRRMGERFSRVDSAHD